MDRITTLLVDDEPRGLSSLQKLLELNCDQIEVIGCCGDAQEAQEKILELYPQLVFMDIAMPATNGFELLRNLPKIDFEIIFVTAHHKYMSQAFHFSAVDYLLKPVVDSLLTAAVNRATHRIMDRTGFEPAETLRHNLQYKDKPKLCIPTPKGYQMVEINDIIYCEASSNYTNFHFAHRAVICASKPILEYELLLEDCSFVRVHKSFLINLAHVTEYIRGEGGIVVLSDKANIEVSRRKKDLLIARMKKYYKF
jgi:two-component system LytT family response regulator